MECIRPMLSFRLISPEIDIFNMGGCLDSKDEVEAGASRVLGTIVAASTEVSLLEDALFGMLS